MRNKTGQSRDTSHASSFLHTSPPRRMSDTCWHCLRIQCIRFPPLPSRPVRRQCLFWAKIVWGRQGTISPQFQPPTHGSMGALWLRQAARSTTFPKSSIPPASTARLLEYRIQRMISRKLPNLPPKKLFPNSSTSTFTLGLGEREDPHTGKLRKRLSPCKKTCERSFNTCGHHCRISCHAGPPCGLCTSPGAVHCAHSSCAKPCSEPCAPCAESCTCDTKQEIQPHSRLQLRSSCCNHGSSPTKASVKQGSSSATAKFRFPTQTPHFLQALPYSPYAALWQTRPERVADLMKHRRRTIRNRKGNANASGLMRDTFAEVAPRNRGTGEWSLKTQTPLYTDGAVVGARMEGGLAHRHSFQASSVQDGAEGQEEPRKRDGRRRITRHAIVEKDGALRVWTACC
jgi:hypothetical protein